MGSYRVRLYLSRITNGQPNILCQNSSQVHTGAVFFVVRRRLVVYSVVKLSFLKVHSARTAAQGPAHRGSTARIWRIWKKVHVFGNANFCLSRAKRWGRRVSTCLAALPRTELRSAGTGQRLQNRNSKIIQIYHSMQLFPELFRLCCQGPHLEALKALTFI
ncbi:Hypothetical_protein [Hexamita inflata]|uniref:Hypothetical_protein n=1 Tax=Hexamita inflata TaxID=28002 RepID=A0ABP1GEV4_9EUKA